MTTPVAWTVTEAPFVTAAPAPSLMILYVVLYPEIGVMSAMMSGAQRV